MFTQCPSCRTVFNVKPEQLAAAHGKVRCSRCHGIFNARDNQYSPPDTAAKPAEKKPAPVPPPQVQKPAPRTPSAEKPPQKQADSKPVVKPTPPAEKKPAAATKPEKPAPEKVPPVADEVPTDDWFDLTPSPAPEEKPRAAKKSAQPAREKPQATEKTVSVEDELNADLFKLFDEPEFVEPAPSTSTASANADKKDKQTDSAAGVEPVTEEPSVASEASAGEPRTQDETAETEEKAENKEMPGGYSLPPQLESRPVRATLRTLFLSISVLLLIAALVIQYAYQHRVPLRENDTLRPWLDTLCQLTNCPMPPKRDPDKIELVDNMMQSHPRYQNSLLVTATLINRADYAQPYPIVEITMTDLQQKVVAQRSFRPEEYLAGDFAKMGFTPNVEVPLMLELTDPGNNAVGFKFDFY